MRKKKTFKEALEDCRIMEADIVHRLFNAAVESTHKKIMECFVEDKEEEGGNEDG